MLVRLKRTWFGPGGTRYRKGDVAVPDEYRPSLPIDAQVLDEMDPKKAPRAVKSPKVEVETGKPTLTEVGADNPKALSELPDKEKPTPPKPAK